MLFGGHRAHRAMDRRKKETRAEGNTTPGGGETRRRSAWGPPPDSATSKRMARVRHSGTAAELMVRGLLYAQGLRYRVQNRDLPGSPDIANRSGKWAVFVHGCFWHAHNGCKRAAVPERNRALWEAKFERNRQRDDRVIQTLRAEGWNVVVVWECEMADLDRLRDRLASALAPPVDPRS
jgi:DNA mismatch endonuclease, patch repair protein